MNTPSARPPNLLLWLTAAALSACGANTNSDAFDSSAGQDTEPGPTTGVSASGEATMGGPADSDGDDSPPSDSGPLLDVGSPSGGFGSCECDLFYLWVADYRQGTVSKINTRTLVEEGRYLTRPDGKGNPSRTSVNLSGDVAVANRHGGLTKFFADPADCVERNGMPGIQTSSGPGDVLPWEMEECRAWYTEFQTTNQRPVAWTGGTAAPGDCDGSTADVWTVASATPGLFPGMGGSGPVVAYLVDGQTGSVEHEVVVEDFPGNSFGAYGGAVDANGNLFFSSLGGFGPAKLGRVDRDTFEPTVWNTPQGIAPYGITVDHLGRVWLASTLGSLAGRFDPVAEAWEIVDGLGGGSGLAEGPDDTMYVSQGSTIVPIHLETLTKGTAWMTDEAVKGVSFDADGYLWAVTYHDDEDPQSEAAAFKIDVATMTTESIFTDLQDPYTYSDMTGNALGSVACAPEG